jgi:FlaA1/EpsC-like NDP-sugar epimerase
VLHTFRYQIANGGPVTVTDENVTRYFMTVSEAVHLVLQASVLGAHGETLILDMGTPVRIADVARYMIERSKREIDLIFTGLRPGEKLDEILVGVTEKPANRIHPLISHAHVSGLLNSQIPDASPQDSRSFMRTKSTNHSADQF